MQKIAEAHADIRARMGMLEQTSNNLTSDMRNQIAMLTSQAAAAAAALAQMGQLLTAKDVLLQEKDTLIAAGQANFDRLSAQCDATKTSFEQMSAQHAEYKNAFDQLTAANAKLKSELAEVTDHRDQLILRKTNPAEALRISELMSDTDYATFARSIELTCRSIMCVTEYIPRDSIRSADILLDCVLSQIDDLVKIVPERDLRPVMYAVIDRWPDCLVYGVDVHRPEQVAIQCYIDDPRIAKWRKNLTVSSYNHRQIISFLRHTVRYAATMAFIVVKTHPSIGSVSNPDIIERTITHNPI
jgi:hypothetical protein